MSRNSILCALSIASLAGMLLLSRSARVEGANTQGLISSRGTSPTTAVIHSGGFSPASLTDAEIDDLLEHFGSRKSATSFRLDKTVKAGETIIADVYETGQGECVFTSLVPRIKVLKDGSKVVELKFECVGVSSSGQQRRVFDGFSDVRDLAPHNVYSMVKLTPEGQHHLGLKAQIENDGESIRLEATCGYEKRPESRSILED